MAELARSYARSKQTLAFDQLVQIAKESLQEPAPHFYLHDEVQVVVKHHLKFFLAVAPHTRRLNPSAAGMMGRDLWQMGKSESQHFGDAMSKAFGYCSTAGPKAQTGAKLSKEVWQVFQAIEAAHPEAAASSQMKAEPPSTGLPSPKKLIPSKRSLEKCLSSPSQVLKIYGANPEPVAAVAVKREPKAAVKLEPAVAVKREKKPVKIYVHVYIHAIYIYIYICVYTCKEEVASFMLCLPKQVF